MSRARKTRSRASKVLKGLVKASEALESLG